MKLKTIATKTFALGKCEKIMAACAILSGGLHTPFNQIRHILRPLGIQYGGAFTGQCHGLSVTWLKAKRRWFDPKSSSMVIRSRFWDSRLGTMQKIINRQQGQAITVQMTPQYLALMAQHGFTRVQHRTFLDTEITSLGKFLIRPKFLGVRYYLLHTPLHTMAATCSGTTARFYDPNGGEVTFDFSPKMMAFLGFYLYDRTIRYHLLRHGSLDVDEFRA